MVVRSARRLSGLTTAVFACGHSGFLFFFLGCVRRRCFKAGCGGCGVVIVIIHDTTANYSTSIHVRVDVAAHRIGLAAAALSVVMKAKGGDSQAEKLDANNNHTKKCLTFCRFVKKSVFLYLGDNVCLTVRQEKRFSLAVRQEKRSFVPRSTNL